MLSHNFGDKTAKYATKNVKYYNKRQNNHRTKLLKWTRA